MAFSRGSAKESPEPRSMVRRRVEENRVADFEVRVIPVCSVPAQSEFQNLGSQLHSLELHYPLS